LTKVAINRALISVYDKAGLAGLATALHQAGVEIVSTGSTAAAISGAGVPVTPVDQLTGFPECLDGRVKTLHPAVHAGLLADLSQPSHRAQLDELGIAPCDDQKAIRRAYAARLKKLDPLVARRRLVGMLQRRGFEYEAIKPVVDEVLGNSSQ